MAPCSLHPRGLGRLAHLGRVGAGSCNLERAVCGDLWSVKRGANAFRSPKRDGSLAALLPRMSSSYRLAMPGRKRASAVTEEGSFGSVTVDRPTALKLLQDPHQAGADVVHPTECEGNEP